MSRVLSVVTQQIQYMQATTGLVDLAAISQLRDGYNNLLDSAKLINNVSVSFLCLASADVVHMLSMLTLLANFASHWRGTIQHFFKLTLYFIAASCVFTTITQQQSLNSCSSAV